MRVLGMKDVDIFVELPSNSRVCIDFYPLRLQRQYLQGTRLLRGYTLHLLRLVDQYLFFVLLGNCLSENFVICYSELPKEAMR